MTRIIKVDCEKWERRGWKCLRVLFYIGWSLGTIGLGYLEYAWINFAWPQIHDARALLFVVFITILLGLANFANLYAISHKIYENQNLIEFKCVSGIETNLLTVLLILNINPTKNTLKQRKKIKNE